MPLHQYLDAHRVLELIEEAKDHFFSVRFIKRTDGTERTLLCRRHVSKGVTGKLPPGQRRAEDAAAGVVTVFDVQNDGFRRIPLDQVLEVRVEGRVETRM